MSLPYAVAPRPDTGWYNAQVGLFLFLAADVMFFGALISSYVFLRTAADTWPQGEALPAWMWAGARTVGVFGAAALAFSAVNAAWGSKVTGARYGVYAALLGLAYVLAAGYEHVLLDRPSAVTHTYYAVYDLLMITHAVHVAGAAAFSAYAAFWSEHDEDELRRVNRLRCARALWVYLAAVWVVLLGLFVS